jgi:ribose 5-phosphate isomerase RpiB
MKIAIGADHAGFDLKNQMGSILRQNGHEVSDSPDSMDYPDYANSVAQAVAAGTAVFNVFCSRFSLLWSIVLLTIGCVGCGTFSHSATARVTAGKASVAIMDLPGGSRPSATAVAKGVPRDHHWDSQVEFRKATASDEIFLRMVDKTTDGGNYYGDAAFAFDSKDSIRVRRADDDEWRAAHAVALPDRSERYALLREKTAVDDGGAFVYEGRQYRHTGKSAGNFFVSPARTRAAVFSFSFSKHQPQGSYDLNPFTYFVDTYDTSDGKLLASAEGDVQGYDPGTITIQDSAEWVTDRYLFLPLTEDHGRFLVFHFDSAGQTRP